MPSQGPELPNGVLENRNLLLVAESCDDRLGATEVSPTDVPHSEQNLIPSTDAPHSGQNFIRGA